MRRKYQHARKHLVKSKSSVAFCDPETHPDDLDDATP